MVPIMSSDRHPSRPGAPSSGVSEREHRSALQLLHALGQAASNSLRRAELAREFVRCLAGEDRFEVAAILLDQGDTGWSGVMAQNGLSHVDALTAVPTPPAGRADLMDWAGELPRLRHVLASRPTIVQPLLRHGSRQGVLVLAGGPASQDRELLPALTAQLESALENAVVYENMRQSALGFKHLYEVASAFNATLDYHQAVQVIVQRMAASLALTSCSLLTIDRHGRPRVEATTGTDLRTGEYIDVSREPLLQEAIATRQPVPIGVDGQPCLSLHGGLVLPLQARQQLIGLICLGEPVDRPARPLTARETQLAETIASQATIAIDNALLYQELEERVIERTLELRLANADLQARQRELERLTLQLQAIIHSIPDGIVVLTPDCVVRLSNPAFRRIMALPDDVGAKPIQSLMEVSRFDPDHRREIITFVNALTEAPQTAAVRDLTLVTAKGRATYKVVAAPVVSTHHEAEGQVLVFHDVTRERQLDQLKSDFVATVSHELRTPVAAMTGFASLLQDGVAGSITDGQSEYLDKILAQGERLIRLIDDLLDFSKLEAGQMPLYLQLMDAGEALNEVKEQILPLVEAKQMSLDVVVDDDLPLIQVDPDKFRQIVVNLLSNALKFSPEGTGHIVIRARREPGRIVISVSDNGIGIAPAFIDRLFEQFSQADQSTTRKYGGAGLGLAIVKRLVELHGGRIWVTSELNQGTTFNFTIPTDGLGD